jgi:hypothetical protein
MDLDDAVREMGFADEKEFNQLVAAVDISTREKMLAFKHWQYHDGTKEGLLKLPNGK